MSHAEIRIEHRFSCSQETFWAQVFFDPEYNRRLFLEEVGCPRYRLIELEETEQEIVRVQEITPRVAGVPAPIQALVGEGLSYLERDVFTRATRRMQISVTPNRLFQQAGHRGPVLHSARGRAPLPAGVRVPRGLPPSRPGRPASRGRS